MSGFKPMDQARPCPDCEYRLLAFNVRIRLTGAPACYWARKWARMTRSGPFRTAELIWECELCGSSFTFSDLAGHS